LGGSVTGARGQARPTGRATRAQPPGHGRRVGARDGAGSARRGHGGQWPSCRCRARGARGREAEPPASGVGRLAGGGRGGGAAGLAGALDREGAAGTGAATARRGGRGRDGVRRGARDGGRGGRAGEEEGEGKERETEREGRGKLTSGDPNSGDLDSKP
jgi:hypothetical protein